MSDTLHGGKAQTDFWRFSQNSASVVVGIYRGDFSRIGSSLYFSGDTGIPKIRAESRTGHRPLSRGAFLLRHYALVRSRKLLEVEEVAVVSTSLYKGRPDPELVAMCLTGDATAWETLVRRYRRFIYSIPVKFGLQPQDAADIFQTVCVKWIEHLHELRDERKLKPWLFTTTTRQCLTLGLAKQREVGATDEQFEELFGPANDLDEMKIFVERQQAIRDSVERLPARCRSLIEMLYLDGSFRTYQEISQLVGIPAASVGQIEHVVLRNSRRSFKSAAWNENFFTKKVCDFCIFNPISSVL